MIYQKTYVLTINTWKGGRVVLGPNLHSAIRPCAVITGTDLTPTRETIEIDAEGAIAGRYVRDMAFCSKCFHPNRSNVQRVKTPEEA